MEWQGRRRMAARSLELISGMGKPMATMIRAHDATGALRGRAQEATRARGHGADALLDQRPGGFDGVEVIGVWHV
jgi:hypothetical protein